MDFYNHLPNISVIQNPKYTPKPHLLANAATTTGSGLRMPSSSLQQQPLV